MHTSLGVDVPQEAKPFQRFCVPCPNLNLMSTTQKPPSEPTSVPVVWHNSSTWVPRVLIRYEARNSNSAPTGACGARNLFRFTSQMSQQSRSFPEVPSVWEWKRTKVRAPF